jgi:CTP synthase (UTP-ammonia lyase)
MSIPIAIIGDYDPAFAPHRATNAALDHAAGTLGLDLKSVWLPTPSLEAPDALASLAAFAGLWVAPGSPYRSMTGALRAIRFARESGLPLLGTCGGFQHIILEFARHVLGFADATHAEYDPYASQLFISRLACSLVGRALEISLVPQTLVSRTYGTTSVTEQYYCNFGVNPDYTALLASGDLAVVGSDAEGEVLVVELRNHPFFVGTLFVPQLRSSTAHPHPLVVGWLNAAAQRTLLAEHAATPIGKSVPLIRPATPADTDTVSAVLQSAARRLIERGDGMWTLASLAPDCIRPDITRYRIAIVGEVPARENYDV